MDVIKPWDYQESDAELLIKATGTYRDLAALWATGSGKTYLVFYYLARLFGSTFSHAIIACPQIQIRDTFEKHSKTHIKCKGVLEPLPIPPVTAMNGDDLRSYLACDEVDRAFSCCHSGFARWIEILKESFDNYPGRAQKTVVIVDEAQHAAADGLSAVVELCRRAGCTIFHLSATPNRHDRKVAIPTNLSTCFSVERTLTQQMIAEPRSFAPQRILSEIRDVGGRCVSDAQAESGFIGQPEAIRESVVAMVQAWLGDNRPKLIVRVRNHGSTDLNTKVVHAVIQAFRVEGARVYNATDLGDDDSRESKKFAKMLKEERKIKHYSESQYDVIVGIQRVAEGTDWPVCSHIYLWGIPESLPLISQTIGRTTRDRKDIPGYPDQWVNASRIVLFSAGIQNMGEAHSRQTLLVACYLSNYEVAAQWSALKELTRMAGDFDYMENGVRQMDSNSLAHVEIPADVAGAIQALAVQALQRLAPEYLDSRPKLGELISEIQRFARANAHLMGVQISDSQVRQFMLEKRARKKHEFADKYVQSWKEGRQSGLSMLQANDYAFEEILKEFREETIDKADIISYISQVHRMTGHTMDEFAQKLKKQVSPVLVEDEIWASIQLCMKRHGRVPLVQNVRDPLNRMETWAEYDRAFRAGDRGLTRRPGGLGQFIHDRFWPQSGKDWVSRHANTGRYDQYKSRKHDPANPSMESEEAYLQKQMVCPDMVFFYPATFKAISALVDEAGDEGKKIARQMGIVRVARMGRQPKKIISKMAKELAQRGASAFDDIVREFKLEDKEAA